MFATTFAAAALSGLLPVGTEAPTPNWHTDYPAAMQSAVAQQKPIAVFIHRGEAGYNRVVSDGKIPEESGKLLAAGYVCVYVDTDTPAGKTLAGQFQLASGLVISTPGGRVQALRHNGTLTAAELNSYLTKYTQPTAGPVTTEYRGVVQTSAAAPVVSQPAYGQPVYGQPVYGQPVYSGAPGFGNCTGRR
jgi:hypothetical protein